MKGYLKRFNLHDYIVTLQNWTSPDLNLALHPKVVSLFAWCPPEKHESLSFTRSVLRHVGQDGSICKELGQGQNINWKNAPSRYII